MLYQIRSCTNGGILLIAHTYVAAAVDNTGLPEYLMTAITVPSAIPNIITHNVRSSVCSNPSRTDELKKYSPTTPHCIRGLVVILRNARNSRPIKITALTQRP